MSVEKKSYPGKAQNWFSEGPDDVPTIPQVLTDREIFKRKVEEATASVGYVAPSEQARPTSSTQSTSRKVTKLPEPPIKELPPKGKGRPKGDRTVQVTVRIKPELESLIKGIAGDDFTVASIVESALITFAKSLCEQKKYKRMPLDEETLALAKAVV